MFVRDGEHDGSLLSMHTCTRAHFRERAAVYIFRKRISGLVIPRNILFYRCNAEMPPVMPRKRGSRPGHCVLVTIKDPSENYTLLEGNKFFFF